MDSIFCGSKAHREGEQVRATVAIIYHDTLTNGVAPDHDPSTVLPGATGTETAYLCAACAASNEVKGSVSATVIRTLSLI